MTAVKPRIREDLTIEELDGEAVVYDEASTELHHLNQTATIVLRLCDGSATMAEMAADISAVFDVPVTEVEPEVRALIRRFRKVDLLETREPQHAAGRTEGTPGAP